MAEKKLSKDELQRQARRRRRVILGVIICVLVVIGITTIMTSAFRITKKLTDDSAERAEFENRVYSLVMLDVLPFDSLENANQEVLIQTCIWNVMFNEDLSQFAVNEYGEYIIPAVDVDRYAAKLFGPNFKLKHHEFKTSDQLLFAFDEDTQCYTMPVTGVVDSYTPKVVNIKKGRGSKIVTVGYVQMNSNSFMGLGTGNQEKSEPVKYYDYVFTKIDGEFYLTSIEESETKPSSSVQQNTDSSIVAAEPADPNKTVESAINDAEIDTANSMQEYESLPDDTAAGEAA